MSSQWCRLDLVVVTFFSTVKVQIGYTSQNVAVLIIGDLLGLNMKQCSSRQC